MRSGCISTMEAESIRKTRLIQHRNRDTHTVQYCFKVSTDDSKHKYWTDSHYEYALDMIRKQIISQYPEDTED